MNEIQSTVAVCGFGLRITPIDRGPFRFRQSDDASALAELAGTAHLGRGPSWSEWRIETNAYRIPLPDSWTLHASGVRDASPLFELLGPNDSSISVRTSRRMPALESFQGPGHVFRDIGQLDRAGWIEFEHTDAAMTWLHRHEQLHRGTTPFVVTLKTPLGCASTHMASLATIVEGLELPESAA
jgi:hypothetical protein